MKTLLLACLFSFAASASIRPDLFSADSRTVRVGTYVIENSGSPILSTVVKIAIHSNPNCAGGLAWSNHEGAGDGYTFNPGTVVAVSGAAIWNYGTGLALDMTGTLSVGVSPIHNTNVWTFGSEKCFNVTCAGGFCTGTDIQYVALNP